MKEFTIEELEKMRQDAIEEYEHAVYEQILDDEEHDKIEFLRHNVEEIEEEINRRKGEQG